MPDERDKLWTRLEVDEAVLADLELVDYPVSVPYELTGAALPSSACGKPRWLADVSRVRGGSAAMARTLMLCNGGVAVGVLTFQLGMGSLLRCPQSAVIWSVGSITAIPGIEPR